MISDQYSVKRKRGLDMASLRVFASMARLRTSEGRIPHSKLGSVVRFRKDEIDAAIKAGSLKVNQVKSSKKK